ncbi:MAG: DnaJ domain-containing protein [Deltaproteobacteria bacterium]|nr:DnaJ domain-containing protein [Deltaproteobacteria bacterium]
MNYHKPKPIAQGNFSKTPFAHILVYVHNKRLHGTLAVRQEPHEVFVYFRNGSPARVSSTEPGKRLGEVLVEIGELTHAQLQESLAEVRRTGELHGQALVRMGFVDGATLVAGITEQMMARMLTVFQFGNGDYAFYEGVDLIPQGPSELIDLNSWALLMAGIRKYGKEMNLSPYLSSLTGKSFFLADVEGLRDFRFNSKERMLCRKLLESPQDMVSLTKWDALDRDVVVGILYVLLITKMLKVISPEEVANTQRQMSTQSLESLPPEQRQGSWPPEVQEMRDDIQNRAAKVSSQNYYELLGVAREATTADIRKAFFRLAKTYHPDRAAKPGLEDLRETLAYLFANLSEAQNTLIDLDSRENYDASIAAGRKPNTGEYDGLNESDEDRQVRTVIEADRMYQKAQVLMRLNKNAEALELIEQACRNCPEEGEYLATRAYLKMTIGDKVTGEMLSIFRSAIERNPKSERCHYYYALALKKDDRINEARQQFKKVVEMNPRNIDAAREIRLMEMRARNTGKNKKPGFFGKLLK